LTVLVAGLLGLIAGSFLNVVIHRVPRRQWVVWPASHCPACGEPIESGATSRCSPTCCCGCGAETARRASPRATRWWKRSPGFSSRERPTSSGWASNCSSRSRWFSPSSPWPEPTSSTSCYRTSSSVLRHWWGHALGAARPGEMVGVPCLCPRRRGRALRSGPRLPWRHGYGGRQDGRDARSFPGTLRGAGGVSREPFAGRSPADSSSPSGRCDAGTLCLSGSLWPSGV
jgi:hypothetical protein